MAKKQQSVTVPTGDYSIKMPEIVQITADVPVIQNKKEIKQPEPSPWPRRILCCLFALMLTMAITVLLVRRGVIRIPTLAEVIAIFRPIPAPPPECCNKVRYVIARKTYLFSEPQEECYYDRPLYYLREGDPVEQLNQVHQFPNGCTWIKVRYIHVAGAHQESREGWVNAQDITIQ